MSLLSRIARRTIVRLTCLLAIGVSASTLSADLIITPQDATISSGGSGFVDVFISSTSTDNLSIAGYEFAITGSIANGSLQFSSTAQQSNSEQSLSNYVFFGDTSPGNFTAVRQDPVTTSLVGGDFTASGGDVTVTTTPVLLARLEIEHVTGTPLAAVGDTFQLALVNSANTSFLDSSFSPVNVNGASFSNFGTIHISGPASVPEPGSLALTGIAFTAVAGWRWIRRKRSPVTPA